MVEQLEQVFKQSKFNVKEKEFFMNGLESQLKQDNHDLSVQEKLQIVTTCFDRQVNSVIMQMPDLEELYAYKKCVRKYARVKMRALNYYSG